MKISKEEILKGIKRARQDKQILQAEMAYKLNLTQTSYSRIENGSTSLTFDILEKILKILDISFTELLIEGKIEKEEGEEQQYFLLELTERMDEKNIDKLRTLYETAYESYKNKVNEKITNINSALHNIMESVVDIPLYESDKVLALFLSYYIKSEEIPKDKLFDNFYTIFLDLVGRYDKENLNWYHKNFFENADMDSLDIELIRDKFLEILKDEDDLILELRHEWDVLYWDHFYDLFFHNETVQRIFYKIEKNLYDFNFNGEIYNRWQEYKEKYL